MLSNKQNFFFYSASLLNEKKKQNTHTSKKREGVEATTRGNTYVCGAFECGSSVYFVFHASTYASLLISFNVYCWHTFFFSFFFSVAVFVVSSCCFFLFFILLLYIFLLSRTHFLFFVYAWVLVYFHLRLCLSLF
ncbi:hypothetical protein TRSC58_07332 [Trypanosoma rangeli SC58]|uniref:Uncharacterized protein n=1 Tax=Trypanosoma rangeli SC58 TaxID=429131 RepID=A0A061ITJ4_TRYRA|nr:hypothetical protein TRSC58_07332 [Trypanosoma rangeli SC58]